MKTGRFIFAAIYIHLVIVFVPFDFMTSILFLGVYGVLIWAIIHVLRFGVFWIRSRSREAAPKLKASQLVFPLLIICSFLYLKAFHLYQIRKATEYARGVATAAQAQCIKEGHCPEHTSVSKEVRKYKGGDLVCSKGRYKPFTIGYLISYCQADKGQRFFLTIRYHIDQGLRFEGGVGKSLTEEEAD